MAPKASVQWLIKQAHVLLMVLRSDVGLMTDRIPDYRIKLKCQNVEYPFKYSNSSDSRKKCTQNHIFQSFGDLFESDLAVPFYTGFETSLPGIAHYALITAKLSQDAACALPWLL